MIIQTVQRYIEPIIVPILKPLIRQVVEEQIGLVKQEVLAIMKENLANNASTKPANNATTSIPKQLKLKFRNKISPQVYTGKPLLGENETTIEIALVDAITEQIVNTGPESMAKLEIVGFRVGDNDTNDDSWAFEDFQKIILSEKKGKRVLQGNTYLQLKEGVCFVDKISFTHSSEYTKNGWYRLGAGVVDDALMNVVEVAKTEAFRMKDGHATYYEKRPNPSLSDKVCHLQQIRYKGIRFKNLINAGVITVKDLLILLYADPKRLEHILQVKASSKIWSDIIENAQSSNGMFLILDPSNEQNVGVVLDVKLQLKGLVVEPQQYIPVDQLSEKQKADNQDLVKFASQHLKTLQSFEDETSLKIYLQSGTSSSLPSPNLGLENSSGLNEVPDNLNNSNLQMNQSTNHVPMVTSHSERGKEIVPFDDEMIYSTNYYQEHISFGFDGLNLGTATERHAHNATESGTSGVMNTMSPEDPLELDSMLSYFSTIHFESPNHDCHSYPPSSDTDVLVVASQTVSVCTIAQTRWTKVSKLLRRNSVRERISHLDGIQPLKKQRCC